MYEAMRQRAPGSSKLAGVTSTILITGLAGYALANGFVADIARMDPPEVFLTTLPSVPPEPVEPHEDIPLETTELSIPKPLIDPPTFVIDDPSVTVRPHEDVETRPPPVFRAVTTAPTRTPPKLLSQRKPPYPAADIRARNEGNSSVDVCVDAKGHVTAASLVQSSGHTRLDDAALKWVRTARFTPGAIGGAPQSICGHTVVYEWRLEDATR